RPWPSGNRVVKRNDSAELARHTVCTLVGPSRRDVCHSARVRVARLPPAGPWYSGDNRPVKGVLAQHHPLEGLGVAQPVARALAVAQRPAFQELIDPLAFADLRAVGLERAALGGERS